MPRLRRVTCREGPQSQPHRGNEGRAKGAKEEMAARTACSFNGCQWVAQHPEPRIQ